MKQWQYKSFEFKIRVAEGTSASVELDRLLNSAGDTGWELIMLKELSRRPDQGGGSGYELNYMASFKRPKEPLFGAGRRISSGGSYDGAE